MKVGDKVYGVWVTWEGDIVEGEASITEMNEVYVALRLPSGVLLLDKPSKYNVGE